MKRDEAIDRMASIVSAINNKLVDLTSFDYVKKAKKELETKIDNTKDHLRMMIDHVEEITSDKDKEVEALDTALYSL